MTLGQKIRKLRKEREWKVGELAEKSGISKPTVFDHELGNSSPSWKFVQLYAKAFGITIQQLVEGVE